MSDDTSHTHASARCRVLFARMSEYLDHELDDALCREIEEHLDQCPACTVCLATLRRTVVLCRAAADVPQVSQTLSRRLRKMIADLPRS